MKRWWLLLILLLSVTGCDETILHDLDELEANSVRVVLSRAGIDAKKVREGTSWSIAVEAETATRALAQVDESRVLKRSLRKVSEQSKSLIQTREERKHFLERQLAWNLEDTLETLPSVLEARVHLFLTSEDQLTLRSKQPKQSASILIISERPEEVDRDHVKQLISGAAGVKPETVSVLVSFSAAPTAVKEVEVERLTAVDAVSAAPKLETVKRLEFTSYFTKQRIAILVATVVLIAFLGMLVVRKTASKESATTPVRKATRFQRALTPTPTPSSPEEKLEALFPQTGAAFEEVTGAVQEEVF